MVDGKTVRKLAVALALSLAAIPATAGAAADLAGQTTVVGATSAWARVALPQAATLDLSKLTEVGGGRLIGVLLRPAGAPMTDVRAVLGLRINHCWSPGCPPAAPTSWSHVFGFEEGADGGYRLPRGDYDLYLIADGAPVEAHLGLGALAGATVVEPTTAARVGMQVPAADDGVSLGTGALAFSAGGSNPVTAPGGLVVAVNALAGNGPGHAEVGLCWYPNGPPATQRYQGCAGASVIEPFGQTFGPGPLHYDLISTAIVAPGPWALGGYDDGLLVSGDPHVMSMALTYASAGGDDPPTGAPPVLGMARAHAQR